MEYTGERYMPEVEGDWSLEHTHRYLLALELAPGKTVLDIACGEGYGSRILADVAAQVTGVDIDGEIVERARQKYAKDNLSYLQGSATAIPLPDHSTDLVVSFETIEHLAEHEVMLDEIRRVLRPQGVLIISSPDKREYTDIPDYHNEFHVKELYRHEFEALLASRFAHMQILGQRVVFGSVIAAEHDAPFVSWTKNDPDSRTRGLSQAEYLIAVATDGPLPTPPSGIMKRPVAESDMARTLQGRIDEEWSHAKALEAWREDARSEIARLNSEVAYLRADRDAMLASRSWKITRPLRRAAGLVRRLSGRSATAPGPMPVWPPDVRALETSAPLTGTPEADVPRIGVFLHIHYTDLADEMLACLRHVPAAGIHISTDTEAKRDELARRFAAEGFTPDIRICPNQGWDIAPFLVGLGDAVPRYDLLLRLHSKRSTQIPDQVGDRWREMLFSTLAGSARRVDAIVRAFAADPKLGMVSPPVLPHYAHAVHFGGNYTIMRDLLIPLGVAIRPDTPIDFPMGSMFWCRPAVLAPWLERRFSYDDFRPLTDDVRDSSLAHAMERLFFFGCGVTGYRWARIPAPETTV